MILVDWGVLPHSDLSHGLDMQKSTFSENLLGDVLRDEELVNPAAIERALVIQSRQMTTSSMKKTYLICSSPKCDGIILLSQHHILLVWNFLLCYGKVFCKLL
ncbi:hypothetical protein KAX14_00495 [Candidatus Bipolaricaulota bacterium]|nr:hypothetical protein [Candidatus Bipolaricaulota bacterium]